jgi:hypothetical protein
MSLGSMGEMFSSGMGALKTAGTAIQLLGPQSPLVTGDIAGAATQIQGLTQGIQDVTQPATPSAPKGPQIDWATISRAAPGEIAGLPDSIRHALLQSLLKDLPNG